MSNVVVFQSRYRPLRFTTRNKETNEYSNISGAKLTFQIKALDSITSPVLVEKQNVAAGGTGTEIEDTDLTSGIYRVFLQPDDVSGAGVYWCETKMVLNGNPSTIFGPRKLEVTPVLIS